MAIYFIRHGQSEFNAAFNGNTDPMIFDPPLTKLGFEQAESAKVNILKLGINRVITSPFTRAIQTAKIIFDGICPIEVQHGHHELLLHSSDIGQHPIDLKKDFPELAFEHIPHSWWYKNSTHGLVIEKEPFELFKKRISRFVIALDKIKDGNIAIVGHGNAFKEIIDLRLDNCQIYHFR